LNELVELLVSWVVTTALSFVLVIWDERRLARARPERLERAWPPSSRDSALVAFGVLALPLHFARTRGHLRSFGGAAWVLIGLLEGVVAIALIGLASTLVLWLVERVVTARP
jgi:hypothetical protein